MTREELKAHCEKQIEMCEFWAIGKGEKPSGKVYEEHKLILELLEQETVSKESYDHEYFLRKEFEIKIARLEQQEPIIDKIRAEIEELPMQFTCAHEMQKWALDIIDKYKAESEC